MYRAFFDESEQGDVFLVAGWVTDCSVWERFTEDWQVVLDASPSIKYFKHHEVKSDPPSGQFEGWSTEEVNAKVAALVDVICRHEMYGVVTGLKISTYNQAFSQATVPKRVLRSALKYIHPYHSCVFSANAMVVQVQLGNGNAHQIVDFVFDEMVGMLDQCISLYEELKPYFPEEKQAICGSMTSDNDKEVAALQAADLLAGQVTTSLRLGPDQHLVKLRKVHKICISPAYFPSFNLVPNLIEQFNEVWGGLQFYRKLDRMIEDWKRQNE